MINIKTKNEIEIMVNGGKILADTLFTVLKEIKPGVSELEIDALAEKLIREKGGEPGFKKVPGYHHATCISTNDVVVHGIPTGYQFNQGDVVGVDCGVYYKGFHTDMAETIRVKIQNSKVKSEDNVDKFLKVGKEALEAGISQATLGNHVGDISKAIQDIVEGQNGYSVVRTLVGHGVGRQLHEDPEVPGFLSDPVVKTPLLKEGMVIAVEAIYNMGKDEVVYSGGDDWTIKTKDQSLSGLFERTLVITKSGPRILTK